MGFATVDAPPPPEGIGGGGWEATEDTNVLVRQPLGDCHEAVTREATAWASAMQYAQILYHHTRERLVLHYQLPAGEFLEVVYRRTSDGARARVSVAIVLENGGLDEIAARPTTTNLFEPLRRALRCPGE